MISSCVALVFLLGCTTLIHYLPFCGLAAIVMISVSELFCLGEMVDMYRVEQKGDLVAMAVTFLVTIVLGVTGGLVATAMSSAVLLIHNFSSAEMAILGQRPSGKMMNRAYWKDAESIPNVCMVRFNSPLYFSNVNRFHDYVHQVISASVLTVKVIALVLAGYCAA